MSPTALAGPSDALADVQSRLLAVQQRIASITGRPLAAATGAASAVSPSRTFAGSLATAQAELAASSSAAVTGTGTGTGADAATGAATGSTGATGASVVADATRYLGVPYRWGGTDPDTGLDCSGLVQRVMADNGISVPRTAAEQATAGARVPSLDQAQPGDLVVLEGGHHIGIYVGDGKMIHAPKTGDVVKVGKVFETPMTIRRVVPSAAPAASATSLDPYLRTALLGGASSTGTATGTATGASTGTSTGAAAYQSLFGGATARYGLPQGLLSAVAATESGYRAGAVSPAGAQGLMQLMPGTAAELGVDPTDPAQAVDGAARLLSSHLTTFGSVPLALAAYNAGPGAVTRYGGVPPFAETQAYVRKVTAAMDRSA